MPWSIADSFKIPVNRAIVDYILSYPTLSARDEIASVLVGSAKDLPDAKKYCPDIQHYAYMLLHSNNKIFAVAMGQDALVFRLPKDKIEVAIKAGGQRDFEIGDEWIVFNPWQNSNFRAAEWCKIAHDYVTGL